MSGRGLELKWSQRRAESLIVMMETIITKDRMKGWIKAGSSNSVVTCTGPPSSSSSSWAPRIAEAPISSWLESLPCLENRPVSLSWHYHHSDKIQETQYMGHKFPAICLGRLASEAQLRFGQITLFAYCRATTIHTSAPADGQCWHLPAVSEATVQTSAPLKRFIP